MAITRRGRKMRRTKKTHKKHAKRTRKSRRNMRGGYHAYKLKDDSMSMSRPGRFTNKTGIMYKFPNVVDILHENGFIDSTDKDANFIIGKNGVISNIRHCFKEYKKSDLRKGYHNLETRLSERNNDFLKEGTYNDLYHDLFKLFNVYLVASEGKTTFKEFYDECIQQLSDV